MFNGTPAACLPCGTALAATWDVDLVRRGGELQAAEAIAKGASVILGPTVNMQRSPLGGRGFESFSEDPVLAGFMAAATVAGIQSKGVSATIKHFVCNDQEHERMSQDSRVSERALREIYTLPFQIAQRDSKPWAYMSSYNRVNGTHASENVHLLKEILRDEWGFDGMIMSDWTGTYSTTEAIKAGLDLEMPGPPFVRGKQVNHAILCGKLSEEGIAICARRVLQFINKLLPLDIPSNAPEKTIDNEETSACLRELASSSIVLLKNDNRVLPFKKDKSIAVIGPNAKIAAYSGGGSASLLPYYAVTPFDAIKSQSSSSVEYTVGYGSYKKLPLLSNMIPEMTMEVYTGPSSDQLRQKIDEIKIVDTNIFLYDYYPQLPTSHKGAWYATIKGQLHPAATGDYEFSISVAGTAKLYVNGKLLVDVATKQTASGSFFGFGTTEVTGTMRLEKNTTYTVEVAFGSLATSLLPGPGAESDQGGGVRIGCSKVMDVEEEVRRAVAIAKSADQVVIISGLNSDWESEGYDRQTLGLPERADNLIRQVVEANSNTAVVIQSGTPVAMPWANSTSAILQAWYGGNETGNGIADVLFGDVNPSARLPLSFPQRLEDTPTFLNYGSERGRTIYGEDVYIGYRWYEKTKKDVLFPFGHGLSYSDFQLSDISVTASEAFDSLVVSVAVHNVGAQSGSEVVQVYVSQRNPSIARPLKELKGFAKASLAVGETKRVEVPISLKYATSFWDENRNAWAMERDTFDERLDMKHMAWNTAMDAALSWAPIDQPLNVLDVGTGTDIWAIEFAENNPSATVYGIYISLIQPEGAMTRKAYEQLEPGGYVEYQISGLDLWCEDATTLGTALHKWTFLIGAGAIALDLPWEADDYEIADKMWAYWATSAKMLDPDKGDSYSSSEELAYWGPNLINETVTQEIGDGWGEMAIASLENVRLLLGYFNQQVPH
ncbi:glycoside hydrolase family 3 [Seiridium cupressi]